MRVSCGSCRHACVFRLAGALLLALGVSAPAARAQVSRLDKATLVEGLAREQMGELLLHLVETEPSDDPVVDQQIQIAQYRLGANDHDADPQTQQAARQQVLDAMRQLVADFDRHEQRPLWQTDLAQWLLFDHLQDHHHNAWGFYVWGVPTRAQRQAYEQAVVEAFDAVVQADLRFFELQGLLPREPDHTATRVNTGLWTRMIDDYWSKRTAYLLALSAISVAQLPDAADYYAQLGQRPGQADRPDAERERLARLALDRLEPFLNDQADLAGIRDRARVLAGLAYNLLGQPGQAREQVDPVIEVVPHDQTDLNAHLVRAQALGLEHQVDQAIHDLDQQRDHLQARDNLMNRLLLADQAFRLGMADARTSPQVAGAYGVYLDLLQDPALGDRAQPLEDYVYARWEANLQPTADLTTLPAFVRMAVGQMARIEGQRAQEAGEADRAQKQFQRAILVNESLLDSPVGDAILAPATFNLALALYSENPSDANNLLRVADLLIHVADTMPDQPIADDAMALGIDLLRALHQADAPPAGIDQAYRHGASVLFKRYPLTQAADNERLYFGYVIEQLAGQYVRAIAQYEQVPEDHQAYFDAQRERLMCMAALSHAGQRPWPKTVRAAQQVRQHAGAATPDRAASAASAQAGATLVLADAAATAHEPQQAIALLAGFETQFDGHPDLVQLAYEKRLMLLIRVQRYDQAIEQARAMMSAFPDAAAGVIDQVLTQLDNEVARLRLLAQQSLVSAQQTQHRQQAQALASVAARLAQVLLRWARGQGFDAQQMLAFELIQNKSLRLSGQSEQALAIIVPLLQAFPDEAQVISEYADTLFAAGDQASLRRAIPHYDQLITGLEPPYPDLWWNAWLKRLTINDRLGQETQDIPLRVGQLKRVDPNLGGPAFKRQFEKLQARHSR